MRITTTVNGTARELDVDPGAFLLDVLREELDLLGSKEACGEGECGACTVLLDGEPVDSCILFAGQVDGHDVTTVEGLASDGLHPVQEAFVARGAVQCGFCTPGLVVSAAALLSESPDPTEETIREALAGNLCRCTGYTAIVDAVRLRGGDAVTAVAHHVGSSAPRRDGPAKVTGAFRYGVDHELPGTLWAKLVRSTVAHARIVAIDTSRAARLPGVHAILTGADVPDARASRYVRDQPILATDTVRYHGEPLAAIAAETPAIADEAAGLVEVTYEPLPVIGTIDDALSPGAPLVHPDWETYEAAEFLRRDGNVVNRATLRRGDAAAAFRDADHVFEHVYETRPVHQVSLEGRVATAHVEDDGTVHVYSSHQFPFGLRKDLSDILDIPLDRIRVTITGVGGGFGGKLYAGVEPYCVLLAERTGRPVKLQHTREEELTATTPRPGCRVAVRTAVTAEGRFLAREATLHFDSGAYSESTPGIVSVALLSLPGPYRWDALSIDAHAVYTNKANAGSYRAPGAAETVFAGESQVDEIAAALGIDPLELRRRNLVEDGDPGPSGQVLEAVSIRETLDAAAARIGWGDPSAPSTGKGLACGWWTTTGGPSGALLRIDDEGGITLVTGATEIGTAAVEAGLVQVVADELGVGLDAISIEAADTSTTPYDFGSQGSRTLFQNGNAALLAAEDLRSTLFALAADKLGCDPADLVLSDGEVHVAGDPEAAVSLADLARLAGGVIEGTGTYEAPATPHDGTTLEGALLTAFNSPSFATHACEVEVDPQTGRTTVLRYVAAHDVGFVVNPTYAAGQVAGGAVQGIGQALFEELTYRDGVLANPTLTDYRIPTIADVPAVEVILVERPSEHGPFGMKGLGEPPIIPPAPALGNAIADASGARVRTLPITAQRLLEALDETREDKT